MPTLIIEEAVCALEEKLRENILSRPRSHSTLDSKSTGNNASSTVVAGRIRDISTSAIPAAELAFVFIARADQVFEGSGVLDEAEIIVIISVSRKVNYSGSWIVIP